MPTSTTAGTAPRMPGPRGGVPAQGEKLTPKMAEAEKGGETQGQGATDTRSIHIPALAPLKPGCWGGEARTFQPFSAAPPGPEPSISLSVGGRTGSCADQEQGHYGVEVTASW